MLAEYELCNVELQVTSVGQSDVIYSMADKNSVTSSQQNSDCALIIGTQQSPVSQVINLVWSVFLLSLSLLFSTSAEQSCFVFRCPARCTTLNWTRGLLRVHSDGKFFRLNCEINNCWYSTVASYEIKQLHNILFVT